MRVWGEEFRSRSRWTRNIAAASRKSALGKRPDAKCTRWRVTAGLDPSAEALEALERAMRDRHPLSRLVPDPHRQLGQEAERDVRGLVVVRVASRYVAPEGPE